MCLEHETLLNAPLSEIAGRIQHLTRQEAVTSSEEVTKLLRWIAAQEDKSQIKRIYTRGKASFNITQRSKMDMYAGNVLEENIQSDLILPPFSKSWLVDGVGQVLLCARARRSGGYADFG
ncbi:hypothetical protein HDV00_002384 [Rhizophlyctis rosea]|nr:hypothetical protein HDV00_002384 [Rhizophlyctis rosea]